MEAADIANLINPLTINFFYRLALIFEPLAPTAISSIISQTLNDYKQQGLLSDYKVKTKRIHKFHYRIWLDLDMTSMQTQHMLGQMLPVRTKILRRWFNG